MKKYFVTMTDCLLTNFSTDKNRIQKLVIECENLEEAQRVKRNAILKKEMKWINIIQNKPKYPPSKYLTVMAKFIELDDVWKK